MYTVKNKNKKRASSECSPSKFHSYFTSEEHSTWSALHSHTVVCGWKLSLQLDYSIMESRNLIAESIAGTIFFVETSL